MRWRPVRLLLGRELRDLRREPMALAAALLVPFLLFPLAALLSGRLAPPGPETVVSLARVGVDPALAGLESHLGAQGLWVVPGAPATPQALAEGRLDLALRPGRSGEVRLLLARGAEAASPLLLRIRTALLTWHEELWPAGPELAAREVPILAAGEGVPWVERLLPLLLVLALLSGSAFAALDLLPGEKERGSLETLLVQPLTPWEVAGAKAAVLLLLGIVAGALFLAGTALAPLAIPDLVPLLPPAGLALLLLLALPLAALLAGALLWLGALARTFREGQVYLLPFTLLVLVPAGLGVAPELDLAGGTAWLPVTGTVLALKAALAGTLAAGPAWLAAAAALGWGGLGLAGAARLLTDEEARLGFAPDRTLDQPFAPPGGKAIFWGITLVFALHAATNLVPPDLGPWLQALLLLAVALLLPRLLGLPRERALPLPRPPAAGLAGMALLAAGLALLAAGWLPLQALWLPPAEGWGGAPAERWPFALLASAAAEELLCRGPLLGAFRTHWGPARGVLLAAAFTAARHGTVDRILPAFGAGLLLGALALRGRSVLLPVLARVLALLALPWLAAPAGALGAPAAMAVGAAAGGLGLLLAGSRPWPFWTWRLPRGGR